MFNQINIFKRISVTVLHKDCKMINSAVSLLAEKAQARRNNGTFISKCFTHDIALLLNNINVV